MPYATPTDNRNRSLKAGDLGFLGVRLRPSPDQLQGGILADAENTRCRYGKVETRKGVVKLPWLNRISGATINSYGEIVGTLRLYGGTMGSSSSSSSSVRTNYVTARVSSFKPANFYGVGVFRDPNSIEWIFFAADGLVYRTRPHNYASPVPLPTGVRILSDCTFIQAYNKLYLFRGKDLAPLRLSDIDVGFVDIVSRWASGTTYNANDEVAYGPFIAVTSITSVADKATVTTTNPHGYVSGADITITGASVAAYNGRYNIIVTGEYTFTYQFATGGVTAGTITCSNMAQYWRANASNVGGGTPTAGQSPDTHPTKWTQIFDVIPNADNALYVNNRLLIPTSYTPGNSANASGVPTGYDATSSYTKKDYIVATDYIDEIHFDFSNEFRINQGSEDEIVDVAKFNDDTVIVWKNRSWGVLANVSFDLSTLSLDMRSMEYGMTGRNAYVLIGSDMWFLAERRGLVSIRQTEQNKLQGVDLPLSDSIQPWIERINWNYQNKIRLAYWDNKLYCAVPLDDARNYRTIVPESSTYSSAGIVTFSGLVVGERYRWTPGANDSTVLTGSTLLTAAGEFTALYNRLDVSGTSNAAYTGTLEQIYIGFNNCVLVYDFLTKEWAGRDTGRALLVKEWFKLTYNGQVRLFFLGEDGYINLYEESDTGDQVPSASTTNKLTWAEITTRVKTRGYRFDLEEFKRAQWMLMSIGTLNPSYTVKRYLDGTEEYDSLQVSGTRDRTKYNRPFNATDYVASNVNGDFLVPYRQDYSVPVSSTGLTMTNVTLGLLQQDNQKLRITRKSGRFVQFEIKNTQGRIELHGLTAEAVEKAQGEGLTD